MADRPILFSAPMVRALLADRKTQTRRTLTPQPEWLPKDENISAGWAWKGLMAWSDAANFAEAAADFAPYAIGDRLWVKETWQSEDAYDVMKPREVPRRAMIHYIADGGEIGTKHRPSIFMPRWASRLTLAVTDVRVERLHDISEADALAEGIYQVRTPWPNGMRHFGTDPNDSVWPTATRAYRNLWNEINGAGAWDENPWVMAVTFTVAQRNIDA